VNVLFVNSQKADEFGGGEQWMITAGAGLRNRGHRVWIGGRPASRLLESAREAGFEVLPCPFRGDLDPTLTWMLRRFLRHEAIDVVVRGLHVQQRHQGGGSCRAPGPHTGHLHEAWTGLDQ